jgi:glycosyltransferase involved in cell wall biosynthesis
VEKSDPVLPLSVIIVARNEAANLPRCLASVQGWTAEVVVALNGTTDASGELAAAVGARVVDLPWKGFRDTKNGALELSTSPWALCLDADEAVSPQLRQALGAFLLSPAAAEAAGARFPRKVWFLGRWITHGDWYPDFSLRLVKVGRGRWGGDVHVHEKMVCEGPVVTLVGDLHHFSFPSIASHIGKITPFADLFLRQAEDRGAHFSLAAAVVRPAWRFIRAYILRRGFLDGFPGLYIAWATSFATFVRYSRLYENQLDGQRTSSLQQAR